MPGALLKLLVKDKLPHSRKVPVSVKEWQLKPPRRGKQDYSRSTVNVAEEGLAVETTEEREMKITA